MKVKTIGGRFKIIKRIARGSFGKTYLAEDKQNFHSHCVVKELEPIAANKPEVFDIAKTFFEKEARVLHELSHRHSQIPYLVAYFEENQKFYIVQEFIAGHDLSLELIPNRKLPEAQVILLLEDILKPLSFLHEQKIIHRDIKPNNLMRRQSNNSIVLIDFGAIKQLAATPMFDPFGKSKIGTIIGTPGYMPSEQSGGKARFSSDIYAVGAIGIQALTGLMPHQIQEHPDTGELIWQHEARISYDFQLVLEKMVRYHFKERYPNAMQALKAVKKLHARTKKDPINIFFDNIKFPALRRINKKIIAKEIGIFNERGLVEETVLNNNKSATTLFVENTQSTPTANKIKRRKTIKILTLAGTGVLFSVVSKALFDSREEPRLASNQKPEGKPLKETTLPPRSLEENSSKSESYSELKTFSFEVVTVNESAKEIDRSVKEAKYFSEDIGNNISLEMVLIPEGTFKMGSSPNEKYAQNNEYPQHQVNIKSFSMSKFQITQRQWQEIATLPKIDRDLDPNPSYFKGDRLPIEQISWYDAIEFSKRLSQKTGKEYRLPTEAEWEYAARANTETPFHFGSTIASNLVNYNSNYAYAKEPRGVYRNRTIAVGSFPPNAFGLYDMHGNVLEWCADTWLPNYQNTPTDGSAEQKGNNTLRVFRGGAWYKDAISCRSADRDRDSPQLKYYTLGFRLACSYS